MSVLPAKLAMSTVALLKQNAQLLEEIGAEAGALTTNVLLFAAMVSVMRENLILIVR
jgi:hypothetical protein